MSSQEGRTRLEGELHVRSESDERTVNNSPDVMRHNYRVLSEQEKADMVEIKDAGLAMHRVLQKFVGSREIALAITKLEESVMWAVKGITK